MKNTQFDVADLVPHSGTMSLLSSIDGFSEDSLTATVEIHSHSMFADDHGVPSWIGIEYMAQAIAAFAGMLQRTAGGEPKLGFLLGTRKYHCSSPYFAMNDKLIITVDRELMAENGLSVFKCQLTGNNVEGAAQLNVYQPDDAELFLKGKHNE